MTELIIDLGMLVFGICVTVQILKIINAKRRQKQLQNRTQQMSVYAYPEVNPNVDLDQLLKTFPKLSVRGSVCRDCGMNDQELDRGLRCPACEALRVANGDSA